jgi:DNA-binding beta-propeller fold protein YncE
MSALHAIGNTCFIGPRFFAAFLILSVFYLVLGSSSAAGIDVPVESIAQIIVDDDNRRLIYPSSVFFDPVEEETYIVEGGSGRVVVYGPDFFPRVSIGRGRGVSAPSGVAVTKKGDVYVCQVRNFKNPSARVVVLNGAFFVEKEILLDQIPEAQGFVPRQVAVRSTGGDIYLAGEFSRGLLVLDDEGNFLRRLQPMDMVSSRWAEEIEKLEKLDAGEEITGEGEPSSEGSEDAPTEKDDSFPDIPEEFRPRKKGEAMAGPAGDILGPVLINSVTISRSGKLYLVSPETGKIYVYGQDESFQFSFGKKGGSPGQLSHPKSLAIDEEREVIYVADYMRHTVLVYNLAGNFLFEVGGRGLGPGWFNFPVSVAVNRHGQLIVADLFNKRVQVLEVGYDEVLPLLRTSLTPSSSRETSEGGDSPVESEPIVEPAEGIVEEIVDEEPSGYPDAINDREGAPETSPGQPNSEPSGPIEYEERL